MPPAAPVFSQPPASFLRFILISPGKNIHLPCTSPHSLNPSYSSSCFQPATILELKITRNLQPSTLNLAKCFHRVECFILCSVSRVPDGSSWVFVHLHKSSPQGTVLGRCPDWHRLRGMLRAGHVRGVGLATGRGAGWGVILGVQVPKCHGIWGFRHIFSHSV